MSTEQKSDEGSKNWSKWHKAIIIQVIYYQMKS